MKESFLMKISSQLTHLRKYLFAFTLILVLLGTIAKSLSFFKEEILWIEFLLGGDKELHFFVAFILTISASMSYWPQEKFWSRQVIIGLGISSLMLLEELSQLFLATRTFSFNDWLYGIWGMLAAFIVVNLFTLDKRNN